MDLKDYLGVASIIISIISFFVSFNNSKKVEKYKREIDDKMKKEKADENLNTVMGYAGALRDKLYSGDELTYGRLKKENGDISEKLKEIINMQFFEKNYQIAHLKDAVYVIIGQMKEIDAILAYKEDKEDVRAVPHDAEKIINLYHQVFIIAGKYFKENPTKIKEEKDWQEKYK